MSSLTEQLSEIRQRAYLATPAPGEKFVPKEMLRRSQADVPTLLALVAPVEAILGFTDEHQIDFTAVSDQCVCDNCNLIIGVLNAHQEQQNA